MSVFITNHPKGLDSFWPRRQGVVYSAGPPRATSQYSEQELRGQGLIGIYADKFYPDYFYRERVYRSEYREGDIDNPTMKSK